MDNLTLNLIDSASEKAPSPSGIDVRPLYEQLRPTVIDDYLKDKPLDSSLLRLLKAERGGLPSIILWGPPGSGKTTIARIVGKQYKDRFVEFSAVLNGVKEIKDVVKVAARGVRPLVMFVDEIHRFNKAQQDAFLKFIEAGDVALLGATTENPSFYLNSALLSRAKVVVLERLSSDKLHALLKKGAARLGVNPNDEISEALVRLAGGDARVLLNFLEDVSAATNNNLADLKVEELSELLSGRKNLFYDRSGEEHYNQASAFIKSLRGSDPDAALFWGFRMLESGEDPRFIFRRLVIFASEDIGNADPGAIQVATATFEAFEKVGLPEGRIPLAQCITYLATAPKSNRSYVAMKKALRAIKQYPKVEVPMHLRNAPTGLMKNLGYGEGYRYPHHEEGAYAKGVVYLPKELEGEVFYEESRKNAFPPKA